MRRCVIFGGATILNYERVKKYLKKDDFIVCCDSGLNHLKSLQLQPDLIVGDFDSHENPHSDTETIVLPCEKDDTDTVFAVKETLKRGFREFLFLGVIGNRFDHSLGNVSILEFLTNRKAHGVIVDNYSEMELVADREVFVDSSYSYFSLLNISGTAREITVQNAKYPLTDGEITCDYQYGISNEVLPGRTASVSVGEGKLLLVKVF